MKVKMQLLILIGTICLGVAIMEIGAVSQAQSPTPVVSTSPAPNGVVTALTTVSNKIPSALPSAVTMLLTFLVTELGARGIPTSKPYSWFTLAAVISGLLVTIFQKAQALLAAIGSTFNNVTGS